MSARVVLGVSGASGAMLALDCARALHGIGVGVDLVISPMARRPLRRLLERVLLAMALAAW